MKTPAGILAVAAGALAPCAAHACTICHSPESAGVRHMVLQHDFWSSAAALAAPIPLLLAAILLAAREPGRRSQT
jgi:hypothetical protein